MDIVSTILSLAGTIFSQTVGAKAEREKQEFLFKLQEGLGKLNLASKQIDVNIEEAKNPNRTWYTWRELLGYVVVVSFTWEFVAKPVVATIVVLFGYPAPIFPQFDIAQLMTVLMTMLGAYGYQYVRDKAKK